MIFYLVKIGCVCCKRIRMELEIGYPEHFVLGITDLSPIRILCQQPFSKNSELLCSCALKIQFVLRMSPISRPYEFFVNNRSLKIRALVLLCSCAPVVGSLVHSNSLSTTVQSSKIQSSCALVLGYN